MKFVHTIGTAVGAALVVGAVAAVAAPQAFAVTTPASAITNDPNASNGTLTFLDTSGNVVTSGNDLSRLFDFAAASTDGRSGATKATVYFAFPDHTQADSQNWFSNPATTPATYPNATNPAPIQGPGFTHPVAKAAAGDANLSALLPTTTQDHTAGYDGILQVRLHDTGPGVPFNTAPFWASDIFYDQAAGTWQQVFPAVAQSTSTALSVSPPNGATPGSNVTLSATVSPSAAAGSMQFKDGATNIGSPATVSSGAASVMTSTLTSGNHNLSAVFTPTDSSAYQQSTSNTVSYVIANLPGAPTGVSATAEHAAATVSWTAPAANGGSPITGYDVQYSSNGGTTWMSASSAFHTSTATTHTATGLANGASYVFRVAAINAVGTGAYSTPTSNAVVPFADNSSLSISRSVTIAYGKTTNVTGALTDTTTHHTVSNQPVFLYHRASSTAAWVKGVSKTTSSSGAVTFAAMPTAHTLYRLRFAGTSALNAATSATETVNVTRVVGINAPVSGTHGKSFAIYGGVTPSASGLKMTLQRQSGGSFKTIGTTTTKNQKLPNGKTGVGYVFHVVQNTKGTYSFRVLSAATSTLLGGASATKSVHIV